LSKKGFKENKNRTIDERKQLITNMIQHFESNKMTIAEEITRMMGKPIVQAREEIEHAIERSKVFNELAEEALNDEIINVSDKLKQIVAREPLGTILILSSFDFPVLSIVNHLVPAILSGNSVLLKDNPRTPLIGKHFESAL
jgi:acyl-CoA reductase-like NAD-dependent aldehyde dehydrogenase